MDSDIGTPQAFFGNPIWRQRRRLVADIIYQDDSTQTVLDLGCGEGNLLQFLLPTQSDIIITQLYGLDVNRDDLDQANQQCCVLPEDEDCPRPHPLNIQLFQGSLADYNRRFQNLDCIVSAEVIEHLLPDILAQVCPMVLGRYRPRRFIVTTPNAEYNVYYPDLQYGTPGARFRHWDHKFEWTRAEFQDWCADAAKQYRYTVEYYGVGETRQSIQDGIGPTSQVALFTRIDDQDGMVVLPQIPPASTPNEPVHELVYDITYPHHDREYTEAEILEIVQKEAELQLLYITRRDDVSGSEAMSDDESTAANANAIISSNTNPDAVQTYSLDFYRLFLYPVQLAVKTRYGLCDALRKHPCMWMEGEPDFKASYFDRYDNVKIFYKGILPKYPEPPANDSINDRGDDWSSSDEFSEPSLSPMWAPPDDNLGRGSADWDISTEQASAGREGEEGVSSEIAPTDGPVSEEEAIRRARYGWGEARDEPVVNPGGGWPNWDALIEQIPEDGTVPIQLDLADQMVESGTSPNPNPSPTVEGWH